jgi:hypothetical protein
MLNKKNSAVVIGIGLIGVFTILIALVAVTADNPDFTQTEGVKLAVSDAAYGSVRLPEAISRFQADGANGFVTIETSGKAERLPAGRYHIRFWEAERKDDQGNTWALTGQYFGQDNPFEIKDDRETEMDVGEPIIASVDARNAGSSYSFNQVIRGRRGELIELTRNGSRPQPPKLNIKNKDGSYDRTFSFRYG